MNNALLITIGNPDNAMFPARMRKSPNSLCSISEGKVIEWLLRLVDKSPSNFWRNVVKNRKYLRKNLPAHLRSMLLDKVSYRKREGNAKNIF